MFHRQPDYRPFCSHIHIRGRCPGGSETIPGLLEEVRAVTPDRIREAAAAVKPDTIYFLKGKEAIA